MADCTSITLMIVLLVSRFLTRRHKTNEDRFFLSLVITGLCGAIFELIAFLVDGKSGGFYRFLNVTTNSLIYCSTTTIAILWLWYVDTNLHNNPKRIRTVFLPFVILWGVLILLVIGNIFGGYIYKIDETNTYIRQPFGYSYYGWLALCFIASFVVYIRYRIIHGNTKFFPIWMFLIPVILGCLVQALWYGIASAWLGCAIGIGAIYLNIQSRASFIDNLTGLYNRAFIEHKLIVARGKNKKFGFGGIMRDIDQFKQINDSLGHSVGDEALKEVAKILIKASYKNSLIFRFAGDEFVILVKVPHTEKDQIVPKMIELENAFREGAKQFNASNKHQYQLVFSIGHAVFDSALPDDEFFRQMDIEMYKEKKSHHN